MALTKVYTTGNYFRMDITGSTRLLQDGKGNVNIQESPTPGTWIIQSERMGRHEVLFSELRDEANGVYTAGTWQTFYTLNTGFNPASGGSGALSGFLDYNDLGTTAAPIAVTAGGAAVPLTNDGAGAFTNLAFPPFGVTKVWDVATNTLDFAELNLGSIMHFRVDITVVITGTNAEIDLLIDLGIGSPGPYTLDVGSSYFKSAGTYEMTFSNFIYMGDLNTKDWPAKFMLSSSNALSVVVNGWALNPHIY